MNVNFCRLWSLRSLEKYSSRRFQLLQLASPELAWAWKAIHWCGQSQSYPEQYWSFQWCDGWAIVRITSDSSLKTNMEGISYRCQVLVEQHSERLIGFWSANTSTILEIGTEWIVNIQVNRSTWRLLHNRTSGNHVTCDAAQPRSHSTDKAPVICPPGIRSHIKQLQRLLFYLHTFKTNLPYGLKFTMCVSPLIPLKICG